MKNAPSTAVQSEVRMTFLGIIWACIVSVKINTHNQKPTTNVNVKTFWSQISFYNGINIQNSIKELSVNVNTSGVTREWNIFLCRWITKWPPMQLNWRHKSIKVLASEDYSQNCLREPEQGQGSIPTSLETNLNSLSEWFTWLQGKVQEPL